MCRQGQQHSMLTAPDELGSVPWALPISLSCVSWRNAAPDAPMRSVGCANTPQ